MAASRQGRDEVVDLLLEYGANPDKQDNVRNFTQLLYVHVHIHNSHAVEHSYLVLQSCGISYRVHTHHILE